MKTGKRFMARLGEVVIAGKSNVQVLVYDGANYQVVTLTDDEHAIAYRDGRANGGEWPFLEATFGPKEGA